MAASENSDTGSTGVTIAALLLGVGIIFPPILMLNIPILILRSAWIHYRQLQAETKQETHKEIDRG